jgi:hypothetical protein
LRPVSGACLLTRAELARVGLLLVEGVAKTFVYRY